MADVDKRIGQNLQSLRGDMSQAALASAMKDRGWKWSQPTVAAIEKGDRPLKLAEAEDIADLLDLQRIDDLTDGQVEKYARRALSRAHKASNAFASAAQELRRAQFDLMNLADQIENDGGKLPDGEGTWEYLVTLDPAAIVDEIPPDFSLTPEGVALIADADEGRTFRWARMLAASAYGRAASRAKAGDGGTPTDSAE